MNLDTLFYFCIATTACSVAFIMYLLLQRVPRSGLPQATYKPRRIDDRVSSGSHAAERKASSTSTRKPMATLNRKQRRTLESLARRNKLPKMSNVVQS